MKKRIYILLFALLTAFTHGQNIQNIMLEPNVNHKARHLKQGLNRGGDSLILESSKKAIRQVDIFNEYFLESIVINKNKTKIDLNILPAGNFIVQARIGRKRIVMYIEKFESTNVAYSEMEKQDQSIDNVTLEDKLSRKEIRERRKKNVIYYWTVQQSNSNFGATKRMKLIYKDEVSDLIEKNKLELKSDIGKDNTLVVYAIYDKNKFMKKQYRNPKYYKSARKSKFFNIVPIYSSNNEVETIPTSIQY